MAFSKVKMYEVGDADRMHMWESKKQENCLGMSGTVSSEGMAGAE